MKTIQLLLVSLVLSLSTNAFADDTSAGKHLVSIHLGSHHFVKFEKDKGYNEINPGFGYGYRNQDGVIYSVGIFKDSFGHNSVYGAVAVSDATDTVRAGIMLAPAYLDSIGTPVVFSFQMRAAKYGMITLMLPGVLAYGLEF